VKDAEAFVQWATAKGLIRTKVEAAWSDIKTRLAPVDDALGADAIDTATGECVPGLCVGLASVEIFAVEAR
jgi:hypothetical protein